MQRLLLLAIYSFLYVSCGVQKNAATTTSTSLKETKSGLEYQFVRKHKGHRKPAPGDYVEIHVVSKLDDSVIYDSQTANSGFPVEMRIPYEEGKNDLIDGIRMMSVGDSAIFRLSVDTIIASSGQTQPWMKPGTNQKMTYFVSLVSAKSAVEKLTELDEANERQKDKDDALITRFLNERKIEAKKTKSGLYIAIEHPGTGKMPAAGQKVIVNYTGRTLAGDVFDSNTDPAFNHVQPFSFKYAMGEVIPGWDEGIGYLKPGGKAKLIIPSQLAYGERELSRIKANSILVFDVELLSVE